MGGTGRSSMTFHQLRTCAISPTQSIYGVLGQQHSASSHKQGDFLQRGADESFDELFALLDLAFT